MTGGLSTNDFPAARAPHAKSGPRYPGCPATEQFALCRLRKYTGSGNFA